MPAPTPDYVAPHGLLAGKTVLVTAAAGTGIGFAVAKRAVEEGATVLISDIHERRLGEAADRLAEVNGTRPATALCNVTVEDDVQRLFDDRHRRAGPRRRADQQRRPRRHGQRGRHDRRPVERGARRHPQRHLPLPPGRRCATCSPRRSGVIVNNASVLGWRAQEGQAHYAAAKAGVMALTRCAAIEAAHDGVRINAVAPSLAMHPFLAKVTSDELLAELEQREAFGRAAEPWEVANVMVFLASDYSTYLTGEVVSVSSQRA